MRGMKKKCVEIDDKLLFKAFGKVADLLHSDGFNMCDLCEIKRMVARFVEGIDDPLSWELLDFITESHGDFNWLIEHDLNVAINTLVFLMDDYLISKDQFAKLHHQSMIPLYMMRNNLSAEELCCLALFVGRWKDRVISMYDTLIL
jgi:hypothetical protein